MIARKKIPILLLFMVMATVAIAAGPNAIPYQGSLTASGGAAIPDASYKMRFTMFDDPTVGTQLWQETQNTVLVTGGLFSVELGTATALPDNLFTNPNLYLEVEVDLNGNTTFESNEKYNIPGRQHLVSPFLRAYGDNICTGTLTVVGDLNWSEKTRYYSMCGANFVELESGYHFARYVNEIYKNPGELTSQSWIGQVNLPDGATVTSFTVWYYDNHANDLTVTLWRVPLGTSSPSAMAQVVSSGTPGEGSGTDTSIADATIDNNTCVYWVYFGFPASDTGTSLKFRYARIGYTITGP